MMNHGDVDRRVNRVVSHKLSHSVCLCWTSLSFWRGEEIWILWVGKHTSFTICLSLTIPFFQPPHSLSPDPPSPHTLSHTQEFKVSRAKLSRFSENSWILFKIFSRSTHLYYSTSDGAVIKRGSSEFWAPWLGLVNSTSSRTRDALVCDIRRVSKW